MTTCGQALLLILQWTALVRVCQGSIECACTTKECKESNTRQCVAESLCYVQHLYVTESHEHKDPIIRGCIENKMPLLCENRRPQHIGGPWPTLHCCGENNCNSDVVPTLPAWSSDSVNGHRSTLSPHSPVKLKTHRSKEQKASSQNRALYPGMKATSRGSGINPIYIAVPVAGACVLLAIIIFAIYVLKRQNIYLEDYRYHGNIPQTVSRTIVRDSFHERKSQYSDETDRSSSGSEARLLMKV